MVVRGRRDRLVIVSISYRMVPGCQRAGIVPPLSGPLDDAIAALRQSVALREEYNVISVQHRLLSEELNTTSQRVNLFEKVKIPECRENIRRIGIMLGDAQTAAVARSKIAKKKAAAALA